MAWKAYIVAAVIHSAFSSRAVLASQTRPELNPALGVYQDEEKCFPFQGTLYQIRRNFESDPYLGGTAKCLRSSQNGPTNDDGSVPVNFQFDPDGFINTTFTLMSSPGYTAKNVINVKLDDGSGEVFNLTAAYRDCPKCKVLRHSYIDNGTGCSYWVTDKALNDNNTCCEFIYNLICDQSEKYEIYNKDCP
ncbi:uncharacterized protein LOC144146862 [Haemaphysalis longicornis]